MATKFLVNGQEKSLEMRGANGIDWSADFIATGEQDWECDGEGRYVVAQDDFEWWENMITEWQQMESVIADYEDQFDRDEVDKVVNDAIGGYDLENQPKNVIHGLEQVFGKLN